MDAKQSHKPHRVHKSGASAKKSIQKQKKKNAEKNNPKAFTMQSAQKADRMARRRVEINEKKYHVPMADRTPTTPPPIVVAVVGPSQCGKTTLIKSLVRRYTKHTLSEIRGPVTVVSGKHQRLTFIECANDINAMADVAKVADLVLIMIDGSFGFEMETFEFLNVLQTHGMCKVMGVLTHLDNFRDNKKLKLVKKNFKHRFWTEVYDGAKLFYLSGVENGRYLDKEILNLSRFISVVKLRPLAWRSSHPYLLADRMQDLTDPEIIERNPKADRTVALYGYLRGTHLKGKDRVHIPGAGDFRLHDVEGLDDPCSIPDKERKRLDERHKLIYAPMSAVNGVMYDKDAVYIDVKKPAHEEKAAEGEGERMLSELQSTSDTLAGKLVNQQFSLFSGAKPITADSLRRPAVFDANENPGNDSDNSSDEDNVDQSTMRRFNDSDAEINSSDEDELLRRADRTGNENSSGSDDSEFDNDSNGRIAPIHMGEKRVNLMSLVYGSDSEETKVDSDADDAIKSLEFDDELDDRVLKRHFITGEDDSDSDDDEDNGENEFGDDDTGDFEDLEAEAATDDNDNAEEDGQDNNESDEDTSDEEGEGGDDEVLDENNPYGLSSDKMQKLKTKFDRIDADEDEDGEKKDFYQQKKDELQKYVDITRNEMDELGDIQYKWAGQYVRVVIDAMPYEFVKGFDPSMPIIVGGISNEEGLSLVTIRIKRHRWYPKILKNGDPIVISVGWRRFQTIPTYFMNDRIKNRMLKYTPEHMHCNAAVYGPYIQPGTGFCAYFMKKNHNFGIAATGSVLENSQSIDVVKKIKLTGYPEKIHKNTAYIKKMFNSPLEVAKFEGASIKTVSGVRGQVKKASGSNGMFRGTFEDKIKASDIVFLRAFHTIPIKKFYNPITSLLSVTYMRTVAEIRRAKNMPVPNKKDSHYKKITRTEKKFNPLRVPQSIQKQLPFKSKPKVIRNTKPTRAVIMSDHDRKVSRLLNEINLLNNVKTQKQKEKRREQKAEYLKKRQAEEDEADARRKKKRKTFFRIEGQNQKTTSR